MAARRVAAGVLVLATSMLAGGCGGETDTSANTPEVKSESYANTVCSIAFDWAAASTEIDGYQAGTATDNDVDLLVSPAQAGTQNFIINIRGLPEPDDETQKAAYASLQKTADALFERSQTIATDVDDLETRATQAQAQIELLYGDLQTSVAQLDKIYPDAGVAADVNSRENCEQLHA
jgi:hypothetical protein